MRVYCYRLLLLFASFASALPAAQAYDCGSKYCKQMSSCGEAHYKLTVCGQAKLDRDNDGIPCEVVCGDNLETYLGRLRQEGIEPGQAQAPEAAQPATLLDAAPVTPAAAQPLSPAQTSCGTKSRCKQMLSCEEARFYLNRCGVSSLDRDRDGVPCEGLCLGR